MQTKTNKSLIDLLTILLLLAAFIFAFIMGFVVKNESSGEPFLSTLIVALIAVGGLGILYFSGTVVELVSRIRRNRMNVGFVSLFSVCTAAYVALVAIMLAVLCRLTSVSAFLPRFIYLFAVIMILAGYYFSVVYSTKLEAEKENAEINDAEETVSEE